MDDPWGSPWADEAAQPPKLDETTRKEPITAEKQLALNQGSKSPWDDDDEFGEWATLPSTESAIGSSSNTLEDTPTGQWTSSEINNSDSQHENSNDKGRLDLFTREDQLVHGANLVLLIPKSDSGQPPTDPWTKDERLDIEAAIKNKQRQDTITRDTHLSRDSTSSNAARDYSLVENVGNLSTRQSLDTGKSPTPIGNREASSETSTTHQDLGVPVGLIEIASKTSPDVEESILREPLPSRPSTSPSDRSNHEDLILESPRTSFDDEEKRPYMGGKESSTCGGRSVEQRGQTIDAPDIRSTKGHKNTGSQDHHTKIPSELGPENEYGDLKEVRLGDNTKERQGREHAATEEILAESPVGSPKTTKLLENHMTFALSDEPSISISKQPVKIYDPIKFDVDMSLIDKIFMQEVPKSTPHDGGPKDLLDTENIIQDSFSSTEQRKTWYRISRYGTMRKHNTGDEDSYVRISWQESNVRTETLRTVSRWIEEYRFGSSTVPGVSNSSGTLFGWGQKDAAPMSLAVVLGKSGPTPAAASNTSIIPGVGQGLTAIGSTGPRLNREFVEQDAISKLTSQSQSPPSAMALNFSWSTAAQIDTSVKASSSPVAFTGSQKVSKEEEMEQNRMVKSIVQNLPDLSYMLRR